MRRKGYPLPAKERPPLGEKAKKPCKVWWPAQSPTTPTTVCYNCGFSKRPHYKTSASEKGTEGYERANERTKKWAKASRKEDPIRWMLIRARNRAKSRGMSFNICKDDIHIPSYCPILGIPIVIGGNTKANSPSLDRIDSTQGYIKGNVSVISNKANAAKSDLTLAEIENLYLYVTGKLK